MTYSVLTLQGQTAINWRLQIQELLANFSDTTAQGLQLGEYDEILNETFHSPNAYFCLAFNRTEQSLDGMYLATYMPVVLHRRLYIDDVVVAQKARRQGVLKNILFPHMVELGKRLQCNTIDFTSSKPVAQAAYEALGFVSPTKAYRLYL